MSIFSMPRIHECACGVFVYQIRVMYFVPDNCSCF